MPTNLLNSGRKPKYVYSIKGQKFDSLSEAAATNGVHKATITRWCQSDKKPDCFREPIDEPVMTMDDVNREAEKKGQTPLEFMLEVMNDPNQKMNVRAQMANWAAPYVHPKASGNKGKKEDLAERAKKVGAGKFSSWDSPLKAVK